jgi:uncharacterized integral membrane protein (TIGR00697 family)
LYSFETLSENKNKKEKQTMEKRISPLLVKLVVLFTSCLIISNILANRMIQVGTWSLDAGNLLFPVTYILSDVFSEVYGYKWSRRVTWWAAGMNLLFALLVALTNILPAPEYYDPAPFQAALGSSFRIVAASIISYVTGDFMNDRVFQRMKGNNSTMRGFAWRAFMSSFAGQVVDSFLFVSIAFYGTMPMYDLAAMICLNIFVKVGYELLILPLTYKVAKEVYYREHIYQNYKIGGNNNE